MKKRLAALLLIMALACPSLAVAATKENDNKKVGSLYIYSRIGVLKIYLSNKYVGDTPVELEEMRIGSHLITATKDGETVYKEVAKVNEGEITTVLISEEEKKKENPEEDDGKTPPPPEDRKDAPDGGRKTYPSDGNGDGGPGGTSGSHFLVQGLYAKVGYVSSYIYSYSSSVYDSFYASSLLYGAGYSLELSPYAAVQLEVARGNFANPDASWQMTPMFVNIKVGYPMARGFEGMYYYCLGIGYFQTDLEYNGTNLSTVGFNLSSGIEVPFGDAGSLFIETGYGVGENSKVEFAIENMTFSLGFKLTLR